MKKRIYLMLILMLVEFTISAQIEKGNWYLNGLNVISFQSGKITISHATFNSELNFSGFIIGPSFMAENFNMVSCPTINYGITNQFNGGIFMLLTSYSNKEEGEKDKMSIFLMGPSIRYFLMKEKKFLPFVEGKVGIGSTKYGDNNAEKYEPSGWYMGTGATYFFLPKTGIDFTIGYQSFTNKSKDSESNFKSKNRGIAFGIGVLVGF